MLLGDITDYTETGDWTFILIAILIIDLIVLFLTRYIPNVFGKNLNVWYDMFGLTAVISDVFIIAIGFALARYAYAYFQPVKEESKEGFNLGLFIGLLVLVQALHDILFYVGIILPIPRGHNRMIDVFKDYSTAGGIILFSDAAMMVGSAFIAMILKESSPHIVALVGLFSVYTLPYILETRNRFSID